MAQQLHVIATEQEVQSLRSTAELYDRCQETLHQVSPLPWHPRPRTLEP